MTERTPWRQRIKLATRAWWGAYFGSKLVASATTLMLFMGMLVWLVLGDFVPAAFSLSFMLGAFLIRLIRFRSLSSSIR